MGYFQRRPLVSIAALASYLAIHIFAGVLHHHEAENQLGRWPSACNQNLELRASSSHECGEEESCVLCSVLHLAQILPTALHVEAVALLSGDQFSAAAIIRPHPRESAAHTRGPPLIR
jgi:hypothetical protein